MVDAGAKLNKRVWKTFEGAGFQTKPNSGDTTEEDVFLPGGRKRTVDLSASIPLIGVKIIGENTTKRRLPGSFTRSVHDIKELMAASSAGAGLLVFTQFEPPEADREYAEKSKVVVWGEAELRYYEKLVDTIGEYAKYEMIHSFGLETTEEAQEYSVLALRFNQPTSTGPISMFIFTIPPEVLLKTAVVLRKAQGSAAAYQRMLNKKRLPKIRTFVTSPKAVLPTNVILNLSEYVKWDALSKDDLKDSRRERFNVTSRDCDPGVLRIPLKYASLELIDGQHRLFGFVGADDPTLKHFNLVALGIKDLQQDQRRDAFVAINDTSRRVDANLVAFLKYTDDERECQINNEKMAIKIVYELNKQSPFKGKIKMLDFPDEIITLKGFSGYDLRGLIGERGWLRKYYPNESKEYVSVLRMYFTILKSLFPEQWKDQRKYIVFTNRGISAFLKLLRSMLRTEKRRLDEPTVRRYLKVLRQAKNDSEWERDRLRSAYVGSKGWTDFHKDLVEAIRQVYPDFKR